MVQCNRERDLAKAAEISAVMMPTANTGMRQTGMSAHFSNTGYALIIRVSLSPLSRMNPNCCCIRHNTMPRSIPATAPDKIIYSDSRRHIIPTSECAHILLFLKYYHRDGTYDIERCYQQNECQHQECDPFLNRSHAQIFRLHFVGLEDCHIRTCDSPYGISHTC